MREIKAPLITQLVEELCIEACCVLPDDITNSFKSSLQTEKSTLGKEILQTLVIHFR